MSIRSELNEYLAAEFGLDDLTATDTSPFALLELGHIAGEPVFSFTHDGTDYFAWSGRCLRFLPAAGMSLADLERQELGSAWIARQGPVSLQESLPSETDVPSSLQRRAAIEGLCFGAGLRNVEILEGLYLRRTREFLALVLANGEVVAVHDSAGILAVPDFSEASAWRRLAWAVVQLKIAIE